MCHGSFVLRSALRPPSFPSIGTGPTCCHARLPIFTTAIGRVFYRHFWATAGPFGGHLRDDSASYSRPPHWPPVAPAVPGLSFYTSSGTYHRCCGCRSLLRPSVLAGISVGVAAASPFGYRLSPVTTVGPCYWRWFLRTVSGPLLVHLENTGETTRFGEWYHEDAE